MKSKILLALYKQIFTQVIIPLAREYVEKTDNNWDNEALDFLIELEKYVLTKIELE